MKKSLFYLTIAGTAALASCTKKETTTPSTSNNTNTGVTINSLPQFTGTINGTNYSLINGSVYQGGVGSSKNIGGTGATHNSASYSSYIVDNGNHGLSIDKGTITFPLTSTYPDSATFKAFFAPGKYPYSYNDTTGIEIDWTDPNGNVYTTSLGTGVETGSTFTIAAEQYANALGYQNEKVLINFSCTLYSSTGASIQLTNGVYVGYFENM